MSILYEERGKEGQLDLHSHSPRKEFKQKMPSKTVLPYMDWNRNTNTLALQFDSAKIISIHKSQRE